MSKAILVLGDMPKSCAKCPLITRYGQEYICPPTKCDINGMDAPLAKMRFCPLRPLPERRENGEVVAYTIGQSITDELEEKLINFGFNECLDVIFKEKEND